MAGRNTRIRILIETLTGTLSELLVSRQDTVLSIKWRIYRIEGIPVSQQHLLFRLVELDDATTLSAANVTEGSTLKLVISMRGGPIATRRTLKSPNYDESWFDCKEFFESEETRKNGRYRLELHHDGSSVSIFRIARSYDNNDSSNLNEESPEASDNNDWALDKMRENICTLTKMRDLRKKMETLQLKRNKNSTSEKSATFTSKLKRNKFLNPSKTCTEIISEELELLGLVSKSSSNSVRKPRNLQNGVGQNNYIIGLSQTKYPLEVSSTRRHREDSDSSDETRITQVTRRHKTERVPTPEGLVAGAGSVCFQSESELSLELALSDDHEEPLKLLPTACPVPSTTAGDSSRYRLSCLLLPSGDSPRPQVSPEDLSAREESLETFSMQLESPKLHMDSPVSAKINLSDSIECLEIGNHKSYPNLKSISQYLQQNPNASHELRTNLPNNSHSRFEPPPLQRSSRTYFQSNPALHQLHTNIHNNQCSSTSNLDKTKDVFFSDDFQHSCSTSNLEKLNTQKFETPQLTRHSNTEYLDYTGSYDNLDRVRISKRKVLNMTKNRGLNRSSESLSKINENAHMQPNLNIRNRFNRRNLQSDYVRSFEGLNSISCEAQPLLNKDEHKIIKIPNSAIFREDILQHKACGQNRHNKKCAIPNGLPVIHSPVSSKLSSKVCWTASGGAIKRSQNSALVILEAPTLKNTESTSSSSNHTVNSSKSKERSSSEKSPPEDSTETPAGEPVAKKKRIRCKVCGKRLTITTAMVCRCGGTFCAQHRYAETHNCTYDYKEEGRKQIEQDNPVVTAPKLPKI